MRGCVYDIDWGNSLEPSHCSVNVKPSFSIKISFLQPKIAKCCARMFA